MVAAGLSETTPLVRPPGDSPHRYLIAASFLIITYDIFVIDIVLGSLNQQNPLKSWEQSVLAASAIVGAVGGVTFFGICGDTYGRYRTFLWSASAVLLGAMASVFCYPLPGFGLVTQLSICRFILGIGVGGQYPLIASITAESVPVEASPFAVASIFSLQGFGVLFSSLIPVILLASGTPLAYVWRVSLLVGALPTMVILYKWWFVDPASVDAAMQASVPQRHDHAFADYSFAKIILKHAVAFTGTCSTWFLLGSVYYGMASFRSQLTVEYDIKADILKQNAFSMLFAAATIPGFMMTTLFINKVRVRRLQTFGFFCMALTLVLAAHFQGRWHKGLSTLTLAFTFFFANFGPNATTYILPALYFPVSERTTCHGVSGAFGKVGSIVGAIAFAPLNEAFGITGVFYAFAAACFLGMICTLSLCPDPCTDVKRSKKQVSSAGRTLLLAPNEAHVLSKDPLLKSDHIGDMEANQHNL